MALPFCIVCGLVAGDGPDVCKRGPQVFVGVYGGVVDADLVVEVGAGGAAGAAYVADDLAADDSLAGHDAESGHVGVHGGDAVAVVEDDFLAVAVLGACFGDGGVSGGADREAELR